MYCKDKKRPNILRDKAMGENVTNTPNYDK